VQGGASERLARGAAWQGRVRELLGDLVPPCRAEAPSLETLYQRLRGDGFEVVAISIDKPEASAAIDQFRRDFSLSFPVLWTPRSGCTTPTRVRRPETYLIDPAGRWSSTSSALRIGKTRATLGRSAAPCPRPR